MKLQYTVTPPSTISDALVPLVRVSDGEFAALLKAVSGTNSFSLPKDALDALRVQIKSAGPGLTYLIGVLSYLYDQIDRVVELGEPFESAITKLVEELSANSNWGPEKDLLSKRLKRVLAPTDAHKRYKKHSRLRAGFIPNATAFSSFVDLRPDFDGEDQSLAVKGALTVIQFRVSTDAESPQLRRLTFQMTEESLAELKKSVDRAMAKVAALKNHGTLSKLLVED